MIDSIKLSSLRNNEYAQFIQNFLTVVQRHDAATLQVQEEYDKLLSLLNSIKAMLNEGSGSVITDELVGLDIRRDEAINGIIALVNGYTYSKDATKKAAANLLATHLAGFGAIARDAYQSETSKLQKIAADWSSEPGLQTAAAALNLSDWQAEMIAANTAFDTRYVDRSVDNGMASTSENRVYNKRPEINAAYNDLRDQIDGYYIVKKKVAPWSTVTAALNGVIKDYNALMASRGTQVDATPATATTPIV